MFKFFLRLFPYVKQLEKERQQALTGELNIVELYATQSRMDATVKTKVAQMICAWAKDVIGDAPNYVEISFQHAETSQRYILTVQKADGKTPHQLRMEAEKELAELKDNVIAPLAK